MARKYIIPLLIIILSSCQKPQENSDTILKYYGDVYEDIGYSVAKSDNGYVIAGQLTDVVRTSPNVLDPNSINNKKMGIIKTGLDGNQIWKKSFGDSPALGSKVLVLDDGSVVCTGFVTTSNLTKDIFVVKVDANGGTLMQKIYPFAGNQSGTDIIKTPEGFLVLGSSDAARLPVTDSTGNAAGKKDILLLRINDNLEQIGNDPTIKGFPGNDIGVAIKPDISGGYIVVGTTDRSELKTEQDKNNVILLRVNSIGDVTKTLIIGKKDDEYAADIEVTADGYIIPVTVGADGTNQSGYILKIPSDLYSSPTFGNAVFNSSEIPSYSFKAISGYKSNSFVIAGQTGTGTLAKMLFFAIDADGNLLAGKKKIYGGTGAQVAYDVITDTDDYIIAVGKNSYENNSLITLLKFRF